MTTPRKQTQVFVIDDEESLQRALLRLLNAANFKASAFACVDEFLAASVDYSSACIIADVHTKGTNSLDLPLRLEKRGLNIPVIFITAYDTPETREQVKKIGAAGYFRKPVDDQALIDAIHWAVNNDQYGKRERVSSAGDRAYD
jgi:FixJ family two-component response regulator